MRKFALAIFVCAFLSCENQSSGDNDSDMSLSDSLLSEVLAGHDVAMPKMAKLNRLLKQAQSEYDSLKNLPRTEVHKKRMALLDSTIKDLNYADAAMNEWMDGFKYDSLKNDETQRQAYLRVQLTSVNKMKDVVLSSIAKADSVLSSK
ncbi:hypothetical protein PIECOFPK_00545 [Mycovorax composti]|jgi:hypothetical protein|uniref:Viral A-type inclusion protein n=2 Tax=Chitinophagaceae TaxID=563835 RepID=A0ABZ2EHF1_9BACT